MALGEETSPSMMNGNGHGKTHSNGHASKSIGGKKPFRIDPNAPRKTGFYLAAGLALLVYSITPLAWLTVAVRYFRHGSIFSIPNGFHKKAWYYHCLAEIVFSIYFQYLMWYGSKKKMPPNIDSETLSRLLTKCLMVGLTKEEIESDDPVELHGMPALQRRKVEEEDAAVLRDRLRVWFHFAPINDIYADNIREWLSWAFAGRPLAEVKADAEMSRLIDQGLDMIKHRLQWQNVKSGYNPKVKAICLTLDPMKTLSRPLGYYVVCNSVSHGVMAWLRYFRGFHYEHSGRCSYLVKPPTPASKRTTEKNKALPILFLHGLGIGIGQYMAFLNRLSKHEDGVVILIQPWISADITHPHFLQPPDKDEQANDTVALLKRVGMPKVTTCSHSNGTMVLGWLIRSHPEVCARNILVDPVSFRLWEGSVCYSFVYRRWVKHIEVLLGYFVARELGTARTIGRNFQWSDMCLWVEDLGEINKDNLQIMFGETDILVDVPSCVSYLEESGVPDECITVLPGYQHGKSLIVDSEGMQLVAKHLGLPSGK